MATREQTYTKQLQSLGVYNPAFAPLINDLGEAERQRQRAYKEWRAEAKAARGPRAKPDFGSALWSVIDGLDKKILSYRETLGLTPKALRRVRGADAPEVASGDSPDGIAKRLDAILARAEEYDAPVFELNTSEAWAKDGISQSAAPTALPKGASQEDGGLMRASAPTEESGDG